MKFAFVLFAILGVAYGASVKFQEPSEVLIRDPLVVKNLKADLQDFLDLLDLYEIVSIVQLHLEDPQIQIVLWFLFGPQFQDLYLTLHDIKEYKEFREFLIEHGLEMDRYDQAIREFLGIPFQREREAQRVGKNDLGGVNGLLHAIIEILPLDEIRALALYKLDNSPAFFALYQNLRSEDFQNIVRALRADPTYQFIVEYLEIFGINVDAIAIVIVTIFGWDL